MNYEKFKNKCKEVGGKLTSQNLGSEDYEANICVFENSDDKKLEVLKQSCEGDTGVSSLDSKGLKKGGVICSKNLKMVEI